MAFRKVEEFAQSHFLGGQYWDRLTQQDRFEIMLFAGCEFAPSKSRYDQLTPQVKNVLDSLWQWDDIKDNFRPTVIIAWFDFIAGGQSKLKAWPTEICALSVKH